MKKLVIIGGGPAAVMQLAALSQYERKSWSVYIISSTRGGWSSLLGPTMMQSTYDELDIGLDGIKLSEFIEPHRMSPTGTEYYNYLNACISQSKANYIEDTVLAVESKDDHFHIDTIKSGNIIADRVVLATGIRGKNPDIELGDSHVKNIEQVYRDISQKDFSHYTNKSIAIIGSGNSALQIACYLSQKVRDITVFAKQNKGFFPTETDDRFAWRAESQRVCELVARTAQNSNSHKSDRHLRFIIYENMSYKDDKTIAFSYTKKQNNGKLGQYSLLPNHSNLEHRIYKNKENFIEHFNKSNTVIIWATGVEAVYPPIKSNYPLKYNPEGYLKTDSFGKTNIPNLYCIGSCVGFQAVNFMSTADL